MKKIYLFILSLLISANITLAQERDIAQIIIDVVSVSGTRGIELNGNYLYVSHHSKIDRYDLTDDPPTATTIIDNITVNDMAVRGTDLYVGELNQGLIQKVDLTGISPTVLIAGPFQQPAGLEIQGDFLYFADHLAGQIWRIDVTGTNPVPELLLSGLLGPRDICVSGSWLYYADQIGFRVGKIDITETNPTPVSVFNYIENPWGIEVADGYLYVSMWLQGLIRQYDLSNMHLSGFLWNLPMMQEIDIHDGFLFYDYPNHNKIVKTPLATFSTGENEFDTSIKIFPNPANELLNITNVNPQTAYQIFNSMGQVISRGHLEANYQIFIENLESGIYFIQFDNLSAFKFIKH